MRREEGAGGPPPKPPATPQLDLAFERHPSAGTQAVRRRAGYPYVVTGSFRLDAPLDRLTVIVQSSAGAILGGDRLCQRISVGAGAAAHVTTHAAMPVHRMAEGEAAEEHLAVTVAAGGTAEILPAPRILFPGSALSQSLTLTVAVGGTLILSDGFTRHDPGGHGAVFRRYAGTMTLARPDGRVLATDGFDLSAPPSGFGPASGLVAHGVLLVVAEGAERLPALLEAAAGEAMAGASPLPRGAGTLLRLAAPDGEVLRRATRAAAAAARAALTGESLARPRG